MSVLYEIEPVTAVPSSRGSKSWLNSSVVFPAKWYQLRFDIVIDLGCKPSGYQSFLTNNAETGDPGSLGIVRESMRTVFALR